MILMDPDTAHICHNSNMYE